MSDVSAHHPLVAFAKEVIQRAVCDGDGESVPDPADAAIELHRIHGGVFVTLTRFRKLRGCIGTLDETRAFCAALRHSAIGAALHDSRFAPVRPSELIDIAIHISVLTPPRPWSGLDELVLGQHGIVVHATDRRGVYLPQVAVNHSLDKQTFLSRCCIEKAGLSPDAWRDGTAQVSLFETIDYD